MRKVLLVLLIILSINAANAKNTNDNINNENVRKQAQAENNNSNFKSQMNALRKTYKNINNLFIKSFSISMEIQQLTTKKAKLEYSLKYTKNSAKRVSITINLDALNSQIKSLQDTKKNLDAVLNIATPALQPVNIITYVTGSYKKQILSYREKFDKLNKDYHFSLAKVEAIKSALVILKKEKRKKVELRDINTLIKEIDLDLKYLKLTKDIIDKQKIKIDSFQNEVNHNLQEYKNYEFKKLMIFVSLLIALLVFVYAIRKVQDRYIKNEDTRLRARKYTTNLTTIIVLLSLFVLASDNFTKVFTILGFIGGGIIIASKEEILNIVAWLQIVFSNFIKPGDRIAIRFERELVIGDVLNIGLNRITMFERMTESDMNYNNAGKAGRILHFQNNIIFSPTARVYIYNHEVLNIVYDYLEIDVPTHTDFNKTRDIVTATVTELTARYAEAMNNQIAELSKKFYTKRFEMKPNSYFQFTTHREMKLYIWFPTPEKDIMTMKNILTLQIYKRLSEEGIDILAPNKYEYTSENTLSNIKEV